MNITEIGKNAKKAAITLAKLTAPQKREILFSAAESLIENKELILKANKADVDSAIEKGIKDSLIDRLTLNANRIEAMAEGIRQVALSNDPIGEVISMSTLDNGLIVGKKRVPLGVVGIIFESRPNVTADAFGLCFKSGNSVILRGGKEALNSNVCIVNIFRASLLKSGVDINMVQILEDTSRETAKEMMRLNGYIDVLIPRGGASLIQTVVQNATVPVIETGIGNCHVFVDETGKMDDAVNIIINAKTQRPGVCNACESILIHDKIADTFLPKVAEALISKNVEIRGDERTIAIVKEAVKAVEDDWGREYLDFIISAKVVKSLDEAIEHINKYGTGHSETIITEDYTNAQRFLNEIDAAAVYVNASTRFTDGSEFGFGAEIGISTQKLHARGPMGLKELTTTKYIIYGNGQIRN